MGVSSLIGGQIAFAGGSPPTEVYFSFDIPANFIKMGACDFPVNWSGSGKAGTIAFSGNWFVFTSPRLRVVVTNLDNLSNKMTLNVPGAFHQTTEQNGDVVTVVTSRNLLGDPEAGMVLARGTFSYIFDSGGTLIQSLTGTGQLDVCGLIDWSLAIVAVLMSFVWTRALEHSGSRTITPYALDPFTFTLKPGGKQRKQTSTYLIGRTGLLDSSSHLSVVFWVIE